MVNTTRQGTQGSDQHPGGFASDAFGVVDHSGKDEDAEGEEDDKEQELIGAGPQCVAQHPQTHKVTRELEDTQDPHKTDHSEETPARPWLPWRTARSGPPPEAPVTSSTAGRLVLLGYFDVMPPDTLSAA
ncbi:unnamed protein product [Lampetra planeri]